MRAVRVIAEIGHNLCARPHSAICRSMRSPRDLLDKNVSETLSVMIDEFLLAMKVAWGLDEG